mgnify:CR=1 FL=1
MLNALVWALACFGVVAADIALSMVLFSVLDIVSALTGFPVDNLDIQWFQAAAQTASFLMALLWWRYLWPRSFMARWQGVRPLGGGLRSVWKRIACVIVIGLALQVVVGYVTDAVLSLLPEVAADYSELVEETGMGDTSYLAVLTTVLGAPFCEELLVRGIIFEFSLRAFNPRCRPLWKLRRHVRPQDGVMVPWVAPYLGRRRGNRTAGGGLRLYAHELGAGLLCGRCRSYFWLGARDDRKASLHDPVALCL